MKEKKKKKKQRNLMEEQRQAQDKLKPNIEDKVKIPPIIIPVASIIPPKNHTYTPQVRAGPVGPQPLPSTSNVDIKKEQLPEQELNRLQKKAGGWKDDYITQRAFEESMSTLWL